MSEKVMCPECASGHHGSCQLIPERGVEAPAPCECYDEIHRGHPQTGRTCAKCSTPNVGTAKFCVECGTAMPEAHVIGLTGIASEAVVNGQKAE